jgi:hypothetical protein
VHEDTFLLEYDAASLGSRRPYVFLLGAPDPVYNGIIFLRNVGYRLSGDAAS